MNPKKELPWSLCLASVSREWKNGSNSSYNCTPFLHSLLTKGAYGSAPGSVSTRIEVRRPSEALRATKKLFETCEPIFRV